MKPPRPWATLGMAALAVGVCVLPGVRARLLFERDAIWIGELWRLWTAHVTHFGLNHLLWNLAVFVPAGIWAERIAPRRTRWLLAIAPLSISVVLLSDAALQRYGGLSGLAAAVLTLLALIQLSATGRTDRWFWWSVLALLVVKIIAEWLAGQAGFARFSSAEIRPVPLAHLAGVATAAAVYFLGGGVRRIKGGAPP